ncbi:hypothetical protein PSU4_41450 [Pseudonocardia sulfidoxydans NBRC 16205]|uniref:LysM domain-containing protein n=2 Tax=Pseudonocardia sulfidoxydans TaxID=54011 RepID=A0A511DK49_9PSEU|nr:hypothetical protein PSU4_41450 [Pseudonocardia sulfidoxydans NBRC 16205]
MSVSTAPGCAGARSEAEPGVEGGGAAGEGAVRGGREPRPEAGAGRGRRHGPGPRPARPREARRGEARRGVSSREPVAARPGGAPAVCRPALTLIPGGLSADPAVPPQRPAEWDEFPTERPAGRPAERRTERPAGRPAQRPTERPTERPAGRPAQRPTERPTERPAGRPAERPTERPAGRPVRGRCVPAPRVWRRPAGARTVRRAPLALRYRVRRAAALMVLAVVAAGVVVGLGSLADVARDAGPGIPAATAQVVVGQGDTVWDIARRAAPDADPAAAAAHIAELNGLRSAALRPGQVLTVPAA